MTNNESSKVFSNISWQFAEKACTQIVSFIVTLIIARKIGPETYGIVALITGFLAIASVFIDSGLGISLIQKKDADELDFSSVFFANIVLCLIIYTIIFFAAPLMAKLYNAESLTLLVRVASLSVVVSAFQNVQQAFIAKNLIFKKLFFASFAGTVIAGIVGIVMAYEDYGAWALVALNLVNCSIDTIIIWLTVKWKPRKEFSFERLKILFKYGSKVLISKFINTVYEKLYGFIMGKQYTLSNLAYFDKANNISNMALTDINSSIQNVLLPVLTSHQDDVEKVKEVNRKVLKVSFYILSPILVGLIVTSKNLIIVLLTEKWLPMMPYFQLICLINIFMPIHTTNISSILALGKSDIYLRLEIIKKILGLSSIYVLIKYGPIPMLLSLLIIDFISQFLNSYPNKKLINYSYWQQIKDIVPELIISFIMGGIVYCVSLININSEIITLILQIIVGIIVYIGLSILFRNKEFIYLKELIINKIKKH